MRWIGIVCLALFTAAGFGQLSPLTRAEATEYAETSRYEDVVQFLRSLQSTGHSILVQNVGVSDGGRPIPLVVASRGGIVTPVEARREGRLVVYIQANIHGGEVEGKEAILMLLRDLLQGASPAILDKCVLLIAPIYNIDGNEKWGDGMRNRPSQDGPAAIGERANGKGLDLNRDCMKAESPEMRAILKHVYGTWDPEVVMDLHTTNGTRHGFDLTYSPPLNPGMSDGVLRYTRDKLLPQIRKKLAEEKGIRLFDYGNLSAGQPPQWRTFGFEPRYVTNYAGVRNRIAILSEATSYLPFRDRVRVTYEFVLALLSEFAKNPEEVIRIVRAADAEVRAWGTAAARPSLGVRFEMESRGEEAIPIEVPNPKEPVARNKRPQELQDVRAQILDRFRATRSREVPAAYVIPASETGVVELLLLHGVIIERLEAAVSAEADIFNVSEVAVAQNAFQGHRLVRLEGDFRREVAQFADGSFVVRIGQPLACLAFHFLEPESLDGVVAWGFLTQTPEVGKPYSISKLTAVPSAPMTRVLSVSSGS